MSGIAVKVVVAAGIAVTISKMGLQGPPNTNTVAEGADKTVQFNDLGIMRGATGLTWAKATNALVLTGGTFQLSGAGSSIKMDGASASGPMIDLFPTAPGTHFVRRVNTGLEIEGSGGITLKQGGAATFGAFANQLFMYTPVIGTAGTLDLRNGVTAQEFRVYGTYTDAANYERMAFRYSGGVFQLVSESLGSGVARPLTFRAGGITSWQIGTTGHMTTVVDATYDIGAQGSNRPRDGYFSRNLSWAGDGITTSGDKSTNNPGLGFWNAGTQQMIGLGGNVTGLMLASNMNITWRNSTNLNGSTSDLMLTRGAAGVLEQRNGLNQQHVRLYETYTDASNYGRLTLGWITNAQFVGGVAAQLTAEAAGTGALRDLYLNGNRVAFGINGVSAWYVDTTKNLVPVGDNLLDIGTNTGNRARSAYFGTRLETPFLKMPTAGAVIEMGTGTTEQIYRQANSLRFQINSQVDRLIVGELASSVIGQFSSSAAISVNTAGTHSVPGNAVPALTIYGGNGLPAYAGEIFFRSFDGTSNRGTLSMNSTGWSMSIGPSAAASAMWNYNGALVTLQAGATGQGIKGYTNYVDASNNDFWTLAPNGVYVELKTGSLGTGSPKHLALRVPTATSIYIGPNGVDQWVFGGSSFQALTDGGTTIGTPSGSRPDIGYFKTGLSALTWLSVGGNSSGAGMAFSWVPSTGTVSVAGVAIQSWSGTDIFMFKPLTFNVGVGGTSKISQNFNSASFEFSQGATILGGTNSGGFTVPPAMGYTFASSTAMGNFDSGFYRASAGTIELRGGTGTQALMIHNTWTDASNFTAMKLYHDPSFGISLASVFAGTGSIQPIMFSGFRIMFRTGPSGSVASQWRIESDGTFRAEIDNTLDIGTVGGFRPRTIYAANSHVIGVVSPQAGFHGLGGGARLQALVTPAAITSIVQFGVAGTTTCTYYIIAKDAFGNKTMMSAGFVTNTANAVQSAGNFNRITWPVTPGALSYDVLKDVAGTPKLLGTVTAPAIDDFGQVPTTYVLPTRNATADLTVDGQATLDLIQIRGGSWWGASSQSMSIGQSATISGGATAATAVGYGSSAFFSAAAFGNAASAGGGSSIAIGGSSVTLNGTGNMAIGGSASATGTNASVAFGCGAVADLPKMFAAGNATDVNLAITDWYFGSSRISTAPQNVTLQASGGSGTDINGANITIAGGRPTGAGTPGGIFFSTATLGATGSTLRALGVRWQITGAGDFQGLGGNFAMLGTNMSIGAGGTSTALDLTWSASTGAAIQSYSSKPLTLNGAGNNVIIGGGSTSVLQFTNSAGAPILMFAGAGGVLEQRNGLSAQNFRIYNTYTDSVNYERGFFGWATNEFQIGIGVAGTGINTRPMVFLAKSYVWRDPATAKTQAELVNGNTFNLYNSWTDASNYDRFGITYSGGAYYIGAEAAGTGTLQFLSLKGTGITMRTNGVDSWQFNSSGHLFAMTDNTFNIGQAAGNRPQNVYVGTKVSVPNVQFPATQVPSADPNTLDDYEEGTFTPTPTFGGAAVGMTFSVQAGTYTKIGRAVHFMIRLVLTATGSSTGVFEVGGLPFVPGDSGTSIWAVPFYATSMAGVASQAQVGLVVGGTAAVRNTGLSSTNFTNTSQIIISGTYFV